MVWCRRCCLSYNLCAAFDVDEGKASVMTHDAWSGTSAGAGACAETMIRSWVCSSWCVQGVDPRYVCDGGVVTHRSIRGSVSVPRSRITSYWTQFSAIAKPTPPYVRVPDSGRIHRASILVIQSATRPHDQLLSPSCAQALLWHSLKQNAGASCFWFPMAERDTTLLSRQKGIGGIRHRFGALGFV